MGFSLVSLSLEKVRTRINLNFFTLRLVVKDVTTRKKRLVFYLNSVQAPTPPPRELGTTLPKTIGKFSVTRHNFTFK